MYVFIVTLHVVLSLMLVLVILMQPGKGGDVSSAFGGGSSSQVFGAAGPGNFLSRGTGVVAALFMVTSISLALYSTGASRSTGDEEDVQRLLQEGEEGGGFGVPPTAPADGTPTDAAPAGGDTVPPEGTAPVETPTEPAPPTP